MLLITITLFFSKIKALESMLDDTFKQSLEIKEQKIRALESRYVTYQNYIDYCHSWFKLNPDVKVCYRWHCYVKFKWSLSDVQLSDV